MTLLQMSISASVLIAAVLLVRALFLHKLPKQTFLVLWCVVLIRLLFPVSLPSPYSAYTLLRNIFPAAGGTAGQATSSGTASTDSGTARPGRSDAKEAGLLPDSQGLSDAKETGLKSAGPTGSPSDPEGTSLSGTGKAAVPSFPAYAASVRNRFLSLTGLRPLPAILWLTGAFLCALAFLISYRRLRLEFRTSLPVHNPYLTDWLASHPARRTITFRQSDRIPSPLTYGVIRPVILLPKQIDWEDTDSLDYVLEHEMVHIRRLDSAIKPVLAAALCLHWFNPFVWAMFFYFNRDLELSCDETVIRSFGIPSRSAYALTLIHMEETKGGPAALYSHFSKNALEERIRAIMKLKKYKLPVLSAAVLLVIGLTVLLGTSALAEKPPLAAIPDTAFTQEEYEQLAALRPDSWEKKTVANFQQTVWERTDTSEYKELLERFGQDEQLYALKDSNETASFLFHILIPLSAEKWRSRDFSGYTRSSAPNGDAAQFEYTMTLTILDADRLTLGEYDRTRQVVGDALQGILSDKTEELLFREEAMRKVLEEEVGALEKEWSTDLLSVSVFYSFTPLSGDPADDSAFHDADTDISGDSETAKIEAELRTMFQKEWDSLLAPYLPLGLTFEIDKDIPDEIHMSFDGMEVKGIYDPVEKTWITNHAGNSTYGSDAVELIAVYEDGSLTSLRAATPEEQQEWDELRNRPKPNFEGEERGIPGSAEDYASLLSLKTDGYEDLTVADFNRKLLDWTNDNFEAMERINMDTAFHDFRIPLTEDEQRFVTLTVNASGNENAMYVRSSYTGRAREDARFTGPSDLYRSTSETGRSAWCRLDYSFSYHIPDETKLTVRDRDRCLSGAAEDILEFWETTPLETLLAMDEEAVVSVLKNITAKYGTDSISIRIGEDDVFYECQDERSYEE